MKNLLLRLLVLTSAAAVRAVPDSGVFGGPPAPVVPVIRDGIPAPGGPLRILTVEERVGEDRVDELVRVPLFFHPGECADPAQLTLVHVGDTRAAAPIICQADDIRRDASGHVSRMHLYFLTNVKAWQRRQFALWPGKGATVAPPAMPVQASGDDVVLRGDDLAVRFRAKGPLAGGISGIESAAVKGLAIEGVLGPRLKLIRQNAACKTLRETPIAYTNATQFEVRDLRYGSGPLFAKLIVRIGPPGVPDAAECAYLIPRRGHWFQQTARFFPEGTNTSDVVGTRGGDLLHGRLTIGSRPDMRVLPVPAGLRRLMRWTNGHVNPAIVNPVAAGSVLAVPYVQMGCPAAYLGERDLAFAGPTSLRRNPDSNSGTLRAFWTQTRFVLGNAVTEEDLWKKSLPHMQTLVAIVDEPGLTVAEWRAEFGKAAKAFYDIQQWGRGWQQTAAMAYLVGNEEEWRKAVRKATSGPVEPRRGDETDLRYWLPKWAAVPAGEPVVRPRGKPDVGRLDPYNIGYSLGSIPAIASALTPSERLDRVCHTVAAASRITNGDVDAYGRPHIRCFSTAFNMQVGSILFGLYGGQKCGDPQLATYYRDVARQNGVLAIYGRGQRQYPAAVRGPEQSDLLYAAISDLWLRTAELHTGEDLWLHPAVYGRYSDSVDVLADLSHSDLNPASGRSWGRANFFRTQAHDHRWEAWDAAPHMLIFRHANDAVPPGLTDSLYYMRHRVGRRFNWSELFNLFHPVVNMEARQRYRPVAVPSLPRQVRTSAAATGVTVSWEPAAGDVAGYRVYRGERMGGPWTLLNSPYAEPPARPVTATTYPDATGRPEHVYWVTAVDLAGRESRWFEQEPLPVPGHGKK